MYTLVTGFYKYLTQKDEYNILILGLDNAGKTVRTKELLIDIKKVFTKIHRRSLKKRKQVLRKTIVV